uniref:Uncharacterized protein n=1 Tax=Nelumbo nucifera TaxID=4432 RepID=A0A822YPP5_NELNU|nr:TPA_asm: hypothetical protein HUJ06_005200 [Nelumbo nucifera]
MSGFSLRSLSLILLIAFLVWCSAFEVCNARRGKHWRQSRAGISASLSKKKGKSHGSGSSHHHGSSGGGNGSKPKSPAPSPSPGTVFPGPRAEAPIPPPGNSGNNDSQPAVFDVLDFGAKGDGETYDTKVMLLFLS